MVEKRKPKNAANDELRTYLDGILEPIKNPRFEQPKLRLPPITPESLRDRMSKVKESIYVEIH